jgi:hypothetical protein
MLSRALPQLRKRRVAMHKRAARKPPHKTAANRLEGRSMLEVDRGLTWRRALNRLRFASAKLDQAVQKPRNERHVPVAILFPLFPMVTERTFIECRRYRSDARWCSRPQRDHALSEARRSRTVCPKRARHQNLLRGLGECERLADRWAIQATIQPFRGSSRRTSAAGLSDRSPT